MKQMPPNTALTLPGHWYYDESVWRAERKAIFRREWLWVGIEEAVRKPGSYFTAEPAGFPVLVWRDPEGTLRAFHNVCRHRAMKLRTEAAGHCEQLICPYHGWRYDHDGRLLAAPRFEPRKDFNSAEFGLFTLRLATWQGLVFVCMDAEAPDFPQWFGPLKERVDRYLCSDREYHDLLEAEVDCNWKNYVDNYQEGYHIPLVHPQLAQDTLWRDYRVINVEGGCIHEVPAREGSGQPGLFGWKYPNFMFNTYGEGVSFMRIDPLDARRCRIHYSHFRPQGMNPERYHEEVVRYGWVISEEDQFITPEVQKNLEAGVYEAGPLSPRHENGLWHFHQMVRRSLKGLT